MWHLTIMAFYGTLLIGIFGFSGLLVGIYEWWERRSAEQVKPGRLHMRDFALKSY